jgi:hypothetical protein
MRRKVLESESLNHLNLLKESRTVNFFVVFPTIEDLLTGKTIFHILPEYSENSCQPIKQPNHSLLQRRKIR